MPAASPSQSKRGAKKTNLSGIIFNLSVFILAWPKLKGSIIWFEEEKRRGGIFLKKANSSGIMFNLTVFILAWPKLKGPIIWVEERGGGHTFLQSQFFFNRYKNCLLDYFFLNCYLSFSFKNCTIRLLIMCFFRSIYYFCAI